MNRLKLTSLVMIGLILLAANGSSVQKAGATTVHPAPVVPVVRAATRVYVTNSKGDDLTIIDSATTKVIGSIKVGANPHGVVASPDRRTLYVSVEGTDELVAVDIRTNQIKWRVKVGRAPNEVSITRDGRKVFVPLRNDSAIDVVDTTSMKVIDRLKAPAWPHNTYVSDDGRRLYLGSMSGSRITIYDTATHKQINEIAPGDWVRPIALRKDQKLAYVALSKLHGFVVVDLKEGRTIRRVELPALPAGTVIPPYDTLTHGLALTPDERELYVTSMAGKAIYAFSVPDLKQLAKIDVGRVPNWITITPDGRFVWVSNQLDDTVSAIDSRTKKVVATLPVGHEPKRLLAVDIDEPTTASGETKPMTDPPIACNLFGLSAAERSRQQELHELLFSRTTGVRELSNGYAVSLPGTKENILAVAEFISLERVCCSFFRFKLEAGNQDEPLLLGITGGKGVKEFLKSAFKLK